MHTIFGTTVNADYLLLLLLLFQLHSPNNDGAGALLCPHFVVAARVQHFIATIVVVVGCIKRNDDRPVIVALWLAVANR